MEGSVGERVEGDAHTLMASTIAVRWNTELIAPEQSANEVKEIR